MLSFEVRLADLGEPHWRWSGDRWACGRSWARPLRHPAVEAVARGGDDATACIVVRERRTGQPRIPAQAEHVLGTAPCWAGDYLVLETRPGRLRLTAGPFGTAPLYMAARGGTLVGSWDLAALRPHLCADLLCGRAVARALARRHRYSADTLFAGVSQLTERATATFTGGACEIAYPPPAEQVLRARVLRPGVDPVAAVDRILARVAGDLAGLAGPAGIEVSGGIDSANVALTVAALSGAAGVRSFGLLLDPAQERRRRVLTTALGFHDTTLDADNHPPFVPTGARRRGEPHDPRGAYYQEAFDALRAAARDAGVAVMFTGIGGDEATALHACEGGDTAPPPPAPTPRWLGPAAIEALAGVDHNLAPASPLPTPSLLAFAVHNPAYLRAGIWPTAPLAHPLVGRFFRQVPEQWRQGKALLRERLRRAGLDRDVTHPASPESFGGLMEAGMRRHGLDMLDGMVGQSLLVDARYIDGDGLRRAVDRARAAHRVPSGLCDALAVEVGLRSLAA